MSKIQYHIISTGSIGNATVINGFVLVDCGVNFKALQPFYKELKIVLLTHIHSDHFQRSTIKALSQMRPMLRFACGKWLVGALVDCGVSKQNIDILSPGTIYNYGLCNIIMFPLHHNVPNCGYKIHFPEGKVIYATDTNSLNGVIARDYDLYMIEANYDEQEINERIREKQANGEYAYELQVLRNHLSRQKCDEWIYRNIGRTGVYIYMHCHQEKEE